MCTIFQKNKIKNFKIASHRVIKGKSMAYVGMFTGYSVENLVNNKGLGRGNWRNPDVINIKKNLPSF
jgi:hypothetical protein